MAGATRAVMAKVMAHDGAAAAMGVTMERIASRKRAGGGSTQPEFRPGAGLPAASTEATE
jgi:hypothetical protein